MHEIWEKEESDHCRVTAEKKQYWNLKQQTLEPTLPNIFEMNIVKFLIVTETG